MIKTLLLALLLSTTSAVAQDKTSPLVIAGGVEGGKYDAYAKNMAVRMAQRGYTNITTTNNNGSDAITLQACNGKADIWIAQVDAIYTRHQEGCVLTPVADYGTEYAMLFFPPNSDLNELTDLTENTTIAVDGIGSGTELFWKTIVGIEEGKDGSNNDWSKAKTAESSPEQLNTMANFGDIQAALLVRTTDSDAVAMLLEQGWTLGYLWDKDIDDQQFNNKALYEALKVKVVYDGSKEVKNWVYAVRSFIGVSKTHASNKTFRTDVAKATQ